MAVLLPKGTKGFRITDKFWNNKEPSYSITSSFYVKAASLSVLMQDNYMYTVSTDVNLLMYILRASPQCSFWYI